MNLNITSLLEGYRSGEMTPSAMLRSIAPSLDQDPAVWIHRFSGDTLDERARELEARGPEGLPLYGIPFAVKDNIDVFGLPTTAACPAFSYLPEADAYVVRRLLDAGAICIGKTNLDQFATGLVGVRSPYGVPKNAINAAYIPGGSSAGSAVAVASGLVSFALGTDTAGSGRVPAAFNNIVGCKPTRGLLSTSGVVPACRSLDCVSIFATSATDAHAVLRVTADFDANDAYGRRNPRPPQRQISRIGIPQPAQLEFFGNSGYSQCWDRAVASLSERGFEIIMIDFSPFRNAAKLLYEGPWVAERYLATRKLFDSNPDAFHPVTRAIIAGGKNGTAAEAFEAQYRLAALRRQTEMLWDAVDALCTPTAGTIYRVDEVEADPIQLNSNLGHYTNFMNLLDLCGLAVPAGFDLQGLPFGISYAAPPFQDEALLALATGEPLTSDEFHIAVCGAHMTGLSLNHQLTSRGGRFISQASTAPVYRMVALDEMRPGLVRVGSEGAPVELEIWSLPIQSVGSFLAGIPSPLGLGRVLLDDDSDVCGFVCESLAMSGKRDITSLGGWRQFLAERALPS